MIKWQSVIYVSMVVANIAVPIGFLIAWINLKDPDPNPYVRHYSHDPQTQTLMSLFIFL